MGKLTEIQITLTHKLVHKHGYKGGTLYLAPRVFDRLEITVDVEEFHPVDRAAYQQESGW